MVFFSIVFHVLIAAVATGIAVSVVIFVPLAIYIIPYCLWVGAQNTKGKYRELRNGNCFRMARNATILYKSWFSHKAPVFR